MEGQRNDTETQEDGKQETPRNAGAAADKVHNLRRTKLPVTPAKGDEPDATDLEVKRNKPSPTRSTTGVKVEEDGTVTRTSPKKLNTKVKVEEDGSVTRKSPKKSAPGIKVEEDGSVTRRPLEKPKPVVSIGRTNEQASENSDRTSTTPQNTPSQTSNGRRADEPSSSPTPRNKVIRIDGEGNPVRDTAENTTAAPQTSQDTQPQTPNKPRTEPPSSPTPRNRVTRIDREGNPVRESAENTTAAPQTSQDTQPQTPNKPRTEPPSSPTPRNRVTRIDREGNPVRESAENTTAAPQTQSSAPTEEPTLADSGFKGVKRPPQPAERVIPRVGMDGRRLN